jgi:LemA protein
MSTPSIIGLVLLAVLAFWGVGAYNRLSAVRDKLVRRFVEADRVLRVRRKAILAWVAGAEDRPNDSAGVDAVIHACTQADAAGEKARARPTSRGLIASVNMAEQVLERTMRDFMQQPAAAGAANRRAAWVATEVQLAVARQVFNREVQAYNTAVRQFPASIMARAIGLAPTAVLEAGAELSPSGTALPVTAIDTPLVAAANRSSGAAGGGAPRVDAAQQPLLATAAEPGRTGTVDPAGPAAASQTNAEHHDSDFAVGLDTAVLEGTMLRVAAAVTPEQAGQAPTAAPSSALPPVDRPSGSA